MCIRDSVHTPQGLRPVLSSDELLAHLPELNDLCIPETLALCRDVYKRQVTNRTPRRLAFSMLRRSSSAPETG